MSIDIYNLYNITISHSFGIVCFSGAYKYIYIYMYVCMYVCKCLCVYIYIYVIHMYISIID